MVLIASEKNLIDSLSGQFWDILNVKKSDGRIRLKKINLFVAKHRQIKWFVAKQQKKKNWLKTKHPPPQDIKWSAPNYSNNLYVLYPYLPTAISPSNSSIFLPPGITVINHRIVWYCHVLLYWIHNKGPPFRFCFPILFLQNWFFFFRF